MRIALLAAAALAAAAAIVLATEIRPSHRPPQPGDIVEPLRRDSGLAYCRAVAHSDMQIDPALRALPPASYDAELARRLRNCEDAHR